jgi:hypothetical protein
VEAVTAEALLEIDVEGRQLVVGLLADRVFEVAEL